MQQKSEYHQLILTQVYKNEDGVVVKEPIIIPFKTLDEVGVRYLTKAIGYPKGFTTFVSDIVGEIVVEGEPHEIYEVIFNNHKITRIRPGFKSDKEATTHIDDLTEE